MADQDTPAKPKEYVRPMPFTWWLHNRQLQLFMVRELTSVFVAGYSVLLLVLLYRAGQDGESFHQFFEWLGSPTSILLHLVMLGFVAYHSVTWFDLTPKVVIIWRGEDKVGPNVIRGMHYGLWAGTSLLVLVLALLV